MVSTMKVRITVEIECPRAHLWTLFEDTEKLKLWVPGLLELRITSPEPHGTGSTYVMVMQEGKTVREYQGKNRLWEPPHRIREILWGARMGTSRLHTAYEFTDLGTSTRFEYEHELETRGFWTTLFKPLLVLASRRYCRSMFKALKREAERPAP